VRGADKLHVPIVLKSGRLNVLETKNAVTYQIFLIVLAVYDP
jgi:hypothetical protein